MSQQHPVWALRGRGDMVQCATQAAIIKAVAHAGVTQLVEFLPSKQAVAGSSPVSRSNAHRFLIHLCNLEL